MQEHQRADPEAHQDAFGKLAKIDQEKGHQQDRRIAREARPQGRELVLLGHGPGHDGEHAGERRERDEARERRCDRHEHQQEQSMQHARHRAVRPDLTLVAVRAMVPVTQIPPNRAEAMLATPCATSSQLERWRRPVMLSATTAESRHSIPPSSANERADGSSATTRSTEISGRRGSGSPSGMPPKRVPMVSTGRPIAQAIAEVNDDDQKGGPVWAEAADREDAGNRGDGDGDGGWIQRGQGAGEHPDFATIGPGSLPGSVRPNRSLIWLQDDQRDAGREADRHGIGNELDEATELQKTDRDQDHAGQHGREQQPVQAVLGHGGGDEHDERAGRPADLEAAPAQRGDQEPAHDGGVETAIRRDAGGDGEGHGQWQRYDGDRKPRDYVGLQVGEAVAFAQHGHQLRCEQLGEAWRAGFHGRLLPARDGATQMRRPAQLSQQQSARSQRMSGARRMGALSPCRLAAAALAGYGPAATGEEGLGAMAKITLFDKSKLPSRHSSVGPERAPHRSYYYAMGLSKDDIARPFVGVVTTWNKAALCNIALGRQAQAVKRGVAKAGGTPREFTTITVTDGIAMGHQGMKSSLVSREVIANSVELTVRGHAYDALVGLAGCDKSLPGLMMAMVRLNVPSVFMSGGSILPGRWQGRDVTVQDVFEAVGKHAVGDMTDAELAELEEVACPSAGSCGGQFTANTMACVSEAIGLALPGSAGAPAPYEARDKWAEESGEAGRAARSVLAGIKAGAQLARVLDADHVRPRRQEGNVEAAASKYRAQAAGTSPMTERPWTRKASWRPILNWR